MRIMITVLLVLSVSVLVGLSGQKSVGGAGANFSTLEEAISAVNAQGLSGDCELILNSGTYTGAYILAYSANSYTLTVRSAEGHNVILQNPNSTASQNYIFRVASSKGLRLMNLTFQGSGTYSRAVSIENDSDNLQITNCTFAGVPNSGSNYAEAIYFQASGNGDTDQVYISLNNFNHGSSAVYVNSSSYNDVFSDWQIFNNSISNCYNAISLQRMNNLSVYSNAFINTQLALYLSSNTGSLDIGRNKISNSNNGIQISYATCTGALAHIYNNIISVYGSFGISLNGTGVNVFHNSVETSSSNTYNTYAAGFSGTDLKIRKNHFFASKQAYAVNIGYDNPSYSQRNILEHNNLFSCGMFLVRATNTDFFSVQDYNAYAQVNNLDYYPGFTNDLLQLTSYALNNQFPSTTLTTDYNGYNRDTNFSDIGAHEYNPAAQDSPLQGNFYIGQGEHFTTIQSFANALHQRGISGIVNAYLTDSQYPEQVNFYTIPGAGFDSEVNFISTTVPHSKIVFSGQTSTSNYTVMLCRVSWLKFRNIDFETSATSYSNLILNQGYNSNLRFEYCRFIAPSGGAGTSLATPYNNVADNYYFLSLASQGNSYGLEIRGSNWDIIGSSFTDQYQAITGQVVEGIRIEYSQFMDSRNLSIYLSQTKNIQVLNCRFSGSKSAITIYQESNPGTERSLIANNVASLNGSNTYGLSVSGSMINVLNNSFAVSGDYSRALYSYQLGNNVDIANNILSSRDGYAMEIISISSDPSIVMDYNCYYTESSSLLKIYSDYNNLLAAQTALPAYNQNSLALNPHLSEDLHTGSPWLREAGMFRTEIEHDMDYEPRGSTFDIGADQQTGEIVDNRLNGSYSIGTPQSDFSTLEAALAALELYGITGNVILNLQAGTYNGNYELRDFPKANSTFEVVIQGSPDTYFVLTPNSGTTLDNYSFNLVSVKNFKLSGIAFSNQTTQYYFNYILLSGRCENVYIQNCSFDFAGTTSNNSNAINAQRNQGENLNVQNCNFTGGNSGIFMEGPYWGTLSYTGLSISNNVFSGMRYPVFASKVVDLLIHGNQITNPAQALVLSYISGISRISNNKIQGSNYTGSFSSQVLVSLSNCIGEEFNAFAIINNIMYLNQSSIQSATALSISGSSHLYLNHNTIISENQTVNEYGSALSLSNVTMSSFWNNVIAAPVTGVAVITNSLSDSYFQNNAWYSSGKYYATINSQSFTLEQLLVSIDPNGIIAHPYPNSSGYTQSTFLKDKAASSTNTADIDGISFGPLPDIGATVITTSGAPLSGLLTVGPGQQFTTIGDALSALMLRGIDGNLILQLSPGQSLTCVSLSYVPGMNQHNILIKGDLGENAPILISNSNSDSTNYILQLNNTRNLTLQDLAFVAQNPSYSKILDVKRYTNNLTITNCSFSTTANSNSSSNNAAVYTYSSNFDGLRIINSTFVNFPFGIYVWATDNVDNNDLLIEQNNIMNSSIAIQVAKCFSPTIQNNTISGYRFEGIDLSYSKGNPLIAANSISGNGFYGLRIGYCNTQVQSTIINNYIKTSGNNSWALYIDNSTTIGLYFNTLVYEGNSVNYGALNAPSGASNLSFRNNVCSASSGLAAYFNQLSMFNPGQYSHNLYYSNGPNMVRLGNDYLNSTLAWNLATGDQYSIFDNPLFEDGAYRLSAGSPARNRGIWLNDYTTDILGNTRNDPPDMGCFETNIQSLDSPSNLTINLDPTGTLILLNWDHVPGAGIYFIQTASTPHGSAWEDTGLSTGNNQISIPLGSASRAFFRIKAMGPQ